MGDGAGVIAGLLAGAGGIDGLLSAAVKPGFSPVDQDYGRLLR
ncbi:MAG: hypothetical protein ACRCYX_10565 [Dermatophilaceae bacterium]